MLVSLESVLHDELHQQLSKCCFPGFPDLFLAFRDLSEGFEIFGLLRQKTSPKSWRVTQKYGKLEKLRLESHRLKLDIMTSIGIATLRY